MLKMRALIPQLKLSCPLSHEDRINIIEVLSLAASICKSESLKSDTSKSCHLCGIDNNMCEDISAKIDAAINTLNYFNKEIKKLNQGDVDEKD